MKLNIRIFFLVVYVLIASSIYLYQGWEDFNIPFYLLTGCLMGYNITELYFLKKVQPKWFLINPMVLAFIANTCFYLGGISNFLLLREGKYFYRYGYVEDSYIREYLVFTMYITCLASMFMWLGYKATIGKKLASIYLNTFKYKKWLGNRVNIYSLLLFIVLGYLAKIILLQYGLYGRVVDVSKTVLAEDTSFLHSQSRFLKNLSIIPYTFIAYFYFKHNKYKQSYFILLGLELFFSLITGARGPILVLTVLTGVIYYFGKQRVPLKLILYGSTAIYIAFTIGQEFKDYVNKMSDRELNVVALVQGYFDYRNSVDDTYNEEIYGNVYNNIAMRVNFVSESAIAIMDKEKRGLDNSDPNFLGAIIAIPLDVFVPASVKREAQTSWGNWFRVKVLHHSDTLTSNTAFSPVGFLYYAGGIPMVFLFFFFYGNILRWSYEYIDKGIFGFLLYIILIGSIAVFSTNVPTVFIEFFRATIFYPIFFNLIFYNHFGSKIQVR